MKGYSKKVRLVVFDTAGTIADGARDLSARWPEDDGKGCKAPVLPFYDVLKNHGVICDWATIRRPMGLYKPDHLRWLLREESVKAQWEEKYGHAPTEEDFDQLLAEFRPLLSSYIVDEDLARPIEGTDDCFRRLHEAGISIGIDTGYFEKDADALNDILNEKFGIRFDAASNGDRVPGRPSPYMIFDCMRQVYDQTGENFGVSQVVKVDDTPAGIRSGNHAGAWTIGVYASGSGSYEDLLAAEPDFLVPDIRYVADVVFHEIENRKED